MFTKSNIPQCAEICALVFCLSIVFPHIYLSGWDIANNIRQIEKQKTIMLQKCESA